MSKSPVTHLRLVHSTTEAAVADVPMETRQVELTAIKPELPVRTNALSTLLSCLEEGEEISFIHQRVETAGQPRYRLLAQTRAKSTTIAARADETLLGLGMVSSAWQFAPCVEVDETARAHAYSYYATLPPVRAVDKSRLGSLASHPYPDYLLPYPWKLPKWEVTSYLEEKMGLPASTAVELRLRHVVLSHSRCHELYRLRNMLASGQLAVFAPESPLSMYSADGALAEGSSQLIGNWLHSPAGFALELVITGSEPVSALALRRLAEDWLGPNFPIDFSQVHDTSVRWGELPVHCLLHPTQDFPAMYPKPSLALANGIARKFDAPANLSETGIEVGFAVGCKEPVPVRLADSERTQHLACLGATGTGKSTFMLNGIMQDIASPLRPVVIVLDPHGSLCQDGLSLFHKSRQNDLISLNVEDEDNLVSINPFQHTKGNSEKTAFLANETVAFIDTHIEESSGSSGPGSRSRLKGSMKLVANHPQRDGTFLDVLRVYEDEDYRDWLMSKSADRALNEQLKAQIKSSGDQSWANWAAHQIPKLTPFASSPAMRRHLSHPSPSLDMAKAIAQGKIMFFNLSQSVLGSVEARIFGNVILNQVFYALIERRRRNPDDCRPVHVYVDESASILTESCLSMLAQGRKYGLALISANQNLGQLRNRQGVASIAEGLMANTATRVYFRLGPKDAERIEDYVKPLGADNLTQLPTLHAAVDMVAHGRRIPPFVMKVQRPVPNPALHCDPKTLVDSSNAHWARPMAQEVDLLCRTFELTPSEVAPFKLLGHKTGNTGVDLNEGSDALVKSIPAKASETLSSPNVKLYEALLQEVTSRDGSAAIQHVTNLLEKDVIDVNSKVLPSLPDLVKRIRESDGLSKAVAEKLVRALNAISDRFWEEGPARG